MAFDRMCLRCDRVTDTRAEREAIEKALDGCKNARAAGADHAGALALGTRCPGSDRRCCPGNSSRRNHRDLWRAPRNDGTAIRLTQCGAGYLIRGLTGWGRPAGIRYRVRPSPAIVGGSYWQSAWHTA